MNQKIFSSLCLGMLISATLCGGQTSHKTTPPGPTAKKMDACSLLTNSDIEAVQGEKVQETKPGTQPGSGLVMSQCVFRTVTPSKSVSVSLAAPDAAHAPKMAPREFWRRQFHSEDAGEHEKSGDHDRKDAKDSHREPEEQMAKARTIKGLGEEAYWISNPVTSVLYVLKGDSFVRISIGGVREEAARLEKSKTLARAAIKHL